MRMFLPLHCWGVTDSRSSVWQHTKPWPCCSFLPFLYPANRCFPFRPMRARRRRTFGTRFHTELTFISLSVPRPPSLQDPTQRVLGSKGARGHGWKNEALLCKAVASLKRWWVDWCLKMPFRELIGWRACNKRFNEGKTWRQIRCRLEAFRWVSSNASDECTKHPYFLYFLSLICFSRSPQETFRTIRRTAADRKLTLQ